MTAMFVRRASSRLASILWLATLVAALYGSIGTVRSQTLEPDAFRLAPGDRISLIVVGQPELSVTLAVDNNGEIQVPLIGTVKVAGDTLAECEAKISNGLSQGYLRDPSIFVNLAEARPVHVLGDVRSPGTFPYRYGSIVKSAIANAGGIGTGIKPDTGLADFLAADERVRVLTATKDRSLLRKARIEAQLAGEKTFTPPSESSLGTDFKSAVEEEQKIFETAAQAYETQRKLLEDQRPLMAQESKALDGQITAQQEQISLLKSEVDAISSLKGKGLARSNSLLELGLNLSTKESDLWKLTADRSRLQLVINDLDARIAQVDRTFKEQLLAELSVIQKTLFEIDISLPSAEVQRANRYKTIGKAMDRAAPYEVKITRVGMKDVESFIATETTRLEPGDIVEVRILVQELDSVEAAGQ